MFKCEENLGFKKRLSLRLKKRQKNREIHCFVEPLNISGVPSVSLPGPDSLSLPPPTSVSDVDSVI